MVSPRLMLALFIALGALFCAAVAVHAQDGYSPHRELSQRLQSAVAAGHARAVLASLGKTHGGRDLWVVTLADGADRDRRPAVLVVGGVDGSPLGPELAVRFVERMITDRTDSVVALLKRVTFYVIPSASPDASEQAMTSPRQESSANVTPFDDDRDGNLDEDPVVDLDGDGWITTMRVRRPSGSWITDPDDPRLMRRVDAARGEVGVYELFPEGRDTDGDGSFGEDGVGGTNINGNFPFDYRPFARQAGAHAVSEVETRALADFCFDHQNVVAVFAFAPQANLLEPWKPAAVGRREGPGPQRGVRPEDESLMNRVAALYRDVTGFRGSPGVREEGGSFIEWAYHHYGRPAFGTPGWWPGPFEKRDSAEGQSGTRGTAGDTLTWLEKIGVKDAWTPWRKVAHPDLRDREVEVGGIRRLATTIPPARFLDSLASLHARFLLALAALAPRMEIGEVRVEDLGRGVRRVRAMLVNRGFLPTVTSMGELSQVPVDAKAELQLARDQHLAAGRRIQLVGAIPGSGGSRELTWLVVGDGTATVTVHGPMVGSIGERIELR